MGNHVTLDLNHVFLLDLGGIGGQLAQNLPVLGEHQQAAGLGLQIGAGGQAQEVDLERALAETVLFGQRLGADRGHCCFHIHAHRGVQQNGHRFRHSGFSLWVQLDLLGSDLELRLVDHFTVHRDPAAFDKQLSLPTGATDQFDKAFGKAYGVSHDKGRSKRGRLLYLCGRG